MTSRSCWGCCVAVALIVAAIVWRSAILDTVDPSRGPIDARLIAELEQALAPGRTPPTEASEDYKGLEYVVLGPEVDEPEFARRCRTVPGWEAMVVVGPYGHGTDIDLDAAGIEGAWLQRRIHDIDGWVSDSIFDVTMIREARVVGGFYVMTGDGLSGSFALRR